MFHQAIDYDELRFRAPTAFNNLIKEKTAQQNVTLIDSEQAMREASPKKVIGDELMLEHLHPNFDGYFIIADSFLNELSTIELLPKPSYPLQKTISQRRAQIALNDIDIGVAEHKIKQLKADYPFTDKPRSIPLPRKTTPIKEYVRRRLEGEAWLEQQSELLKYWQQEQNWLYAANTAGLLYEALPEQTDSAKVAARLYLKAKQPRLAWYYARKAFSAEPMDVSIGMALAEAQYKSDDYAAAKQTLNKILVQDPSHERARFYLDQLSKNP